MRAGVRPVGVRTPSWDFSDATLDIIRELGLSYDSSLMADDECYELLSDGVWFAPHAKIVEHARTMLPRKLTPPRTDA